MKDDINDDIRKGVVKMRWKRVIYMALACMLIFGTISVPAGASEIENADSESFRMSLSTTRDAKSFNMSIPAKSSALADSSFLMAAGENVTIKASYLPFGASMDFGLVDSDGVFHYFNATSGSIDKAIQIDESGSYTLKIRNNSNQEVKVSGFVKY